MSDNKKITKIEIDKDACIGAASCVVLAPDAFELNSENIAELKTTYTNHTDEELLAAARSCPTQAIKLFDSDGNQIE